MLVRALTCVLLSDVAVRAPNCVVESWETLHRRKCRRSERLPRVANCVVLSPDTAEELMAPTWATVREAKELALIEPIWVLLRAPTSLVDSAATCAPLKDARSVVVRLAAWLVDRAPRALLESESTWELLRAAMAAVLMLTTSAAEMYGIWEVVRACACAELRAAKSVGCKCET